MEKIKICDTHNDFLTELLPCELLPYINRCKRNNVEIISASYWSTRRDEATIERELAERALIMQSVDSKFLLHIEDLWWVNNEEKLQFLISLKPFSCSLTWNDQNTLAGGSGSDGGLTEWGKHVLESLSEAGIVIDTAHLNRKSFYEVAKVLKTNIYCSHTGFYGMKAHRRNLTDKQIDIIVKSGGFIGLFFYDGCLKKGKGDFEIGDIVKNLNYFTSRWGFDNIGIGTDFYGIDNYPKGISDYDGFVNLKGKLLENGYSEEQIDKIFYRNFRVFLSKNREKSYL